jgi:hypothetical protein
MRNVSGGDKSAISGLGIEPSKGGGVNVDEDEDLKIGKSKGV